MFPLSRFRVEVESLGAYRIRDHGTPTRDRAWTDCSLYTGDPPKSWAAAWADCARLNTGDLAADPDWYQPDTGAPSGRPTEEEH
ncbi:hypothetical protein Ga0074812_14931 [Parafrankia irregularis]|uniref:Uncharacterized protein n=1 Tax=Parafrankia irregularis TaxID=795642 RepID=A0A0S4QZC8_9ACTN|nr:MULTISPECIES: hypothetical protein [Frankiaceae]KPM50311.1 hypothetical protein ACG83_40955 [Frankia sp. R43]MBE3204709.1 hypothetical protein [Parafrankia sp. CH37]CUU60887.1 hypothetical protein Ga0074812_14931 [Parafrankia irregularis]